jgi:hypothetical protein
MLKSATFLTTAIASILSVSSVANARSIPKISTEYSNDIPKFYIAAKESKSNINTVSQSDLKEIHQAISNFYKLQNEERAPSGSSWSGACLFEEVKTLKLISFSNTAVQVSADIERTSYGLQGMRTTPRQWAFKKEKRFGVVKANEIIALDKFQGKWRVTRIGSRGVV